MKYTNILLTIIAACLVLQVAHSFLQKPVPVTVQTQEKVATPPSTLDVRIVGIDEKLHQIFQPSIQKPVPVIVQNQPAAPSGTLDVRVVGVSDKVKVDIASVGGDALDAVNGRTVLPVGVRNTVGVDIKGVDGHLLDTIPVNSLPVGIVH